MLDSYVRVHRLVNDITQAPTNFDAQLDAVSRAVSKYFAEGAAAYAGGHVPAPPVDHAVDLQTALSPNFPNPAITTNSVWFWIVNKATGQRQLVCLEEETVLTQEKKANGTVVPINPPIGVRVEKLMTVSSPTPGWMPA